jgi:hypothetical protein
VCDIAILADAHYCPDAAARACYQQQRDFNYLELRHLAEDARTDSEGVRLAGMHYRAVILDGLSVIPAAVRPALDRLARAGRLIAWDRPKVAEGLQANVAVAGAAELAAALDRLTATDVKPVPASPGVRYRHVIKNGRHYYLLFNEESEWLREGYGQVDPRTRDIVKRAMPHRNARGQLDLHQGRLFFDAARLIDQAVLGAGAGHRSAAIRGPAAADERFLDHPLAMG